MAADVWGLCKTRALALGTAIAVALWSPSALAQGPSNSIRLVVPFAAGGTADVLGRILTQQLSATSGRQAIVENRPGSGGNLGAEMVAHGPSDGSVLLLGTIGIHAASAIYRSLPFNPARDLQPIMVLAEVPNVLIVNPSLKASSVKEFVALAKQRPAEINFGSAGNGSSTHMIAELFKLKAGVNLSHIPYRGSGPALNDLIGGQIQAMFENLPTALPLIQAGTVRALGVTSAQRSPSLPDLPTIAEAGVPGYEATAWFTVAAASSVPMPVIEKLNADLRAILANPEVVERFRSLGAVIVGSSVSQARTFFAAETEKWNKVIDEARIKID
jgi:tripartite-type tricarboxylate transporter receptor subunit TctC